MKQSYLPSASLHLLKAACALFVLLVCGMFSTSHAVSSGPLLLSDNGSTRAIAVESVTFKSEPFSVDQVVHFSSDNRTRIMLFAMNLDLLAGEGVNAFTADAEASVNGAIVRYPLTVEYTAPVPGFEGITAIIV